ncbi:hypothetical protein GQ472_02420 [archaeon]|nr:hypothetical protein [archaeon]
MSEEFDVKNMDIKWLVETARNKIDTSDLNNYVNGVLSELDHIGEILPQLDMAIEKDKLSKNLYQLTQSLVHNSQTFLLAEKLDELRSKLKPLSDYLCDDNDKNSFNIYLEFIDGIINNDKLLKDNNHDDEWKESFYRRESVILKEISDYFTMEDSIISIMADNCHGLAEMNMGNKDAALAQFNKCISELEEMFCHEDLYNKIQHRNTLTEDEYHALGLAGSVEFNAAMLEQDGEEKINRLDNAISWRNHTLDLCPSYLNNTKAIYELINAYATLAEYMLENCPEKDMKHLLDTYREMHKLKQDILTISPELNEKIAFVYSATELYDNIIEPMEKNVYNKILELEEKSTDKGKVNIEELKSYTDEMGMKESTTVDALLFNLKRKGKIYEPDEGNIRMVIPGSH